MSIVLAIIYVTLLVAFIIQANSRERLIEANFRYMSTGFYISVNIGFPFEYLFFPIDISSEYTWSTTKFFNASKSTTNKIRQLNTKIAFNNTKLFPIEVIDTFALSHAYNGTLADFRLYLFEFEGDIYLKGAFGFSLTSTNSQFSIIELHKRHNMISKGVLSFVHGKYNDGTFYLGGMNQKAIEGKFKSFCSVTSPNDLRWNCKLDSVHINNTNSIYINKHPLYFTSISPDIKAPKDFIDFLWENSYFHSECTKDEIDYAIECVCSILSSINGFSLKIGNYNHEFPIEDLFKRQNVECQFSIKANADANEWQLGYSFLRRYDISFDFDNKRIEFFSLKGISEYSSPYLVSMGRNKYLILSIAAIALMIISLGWLVTATNRRRKKKLIQIKRNIEGIDHSQKEYCLNDLRTPIK